MNDKIPFLILIAFVVCYWAWDLYKIAKRKPPYHVYTKPKRCKEETCTDKEMLLRTKANQIPDHWTILDIVKAYDDYIIGYLRSQGELNQNKNLDN